MQEPGSEFRVQRSKLVANAPDLLMLMRFITHEPRTVNLEPAARKQFCKRLKQ